ncbi:MAG: DUF1194 domain-containing protein, partial [Alphaproteobacteria bacterium]|nr:DUF1194 domain-containing protein [Alphaproteobacteria bacterium]
MFERTAILAAVITVAFAAHTGADAQEVPVDLELVLATDVSASIDKEEASLQRAGYLAALTSKEVI